MVFIARAAEPILRQSEVFTKTIRTESKNVFETVFDIITI